MGDKPGLDLVYGLLIVLLFILILALEVRV